MNSSLALADEKKIKGKLYRLGFNEGEIFPKIVISPFNNLPLIKDVLVNMGEFWQDLEKIDSYASSKSCSLTERGFLQTPEKRNLLAQTANCILCGACYSACNGQKVNDNLVELHYLVKSYQFCTR